MTRTSSVYVDVQVGVAKCNALNLCVTCIFYLLCVLSHKTYTATYISNVKWVKISAAQTTKMVHRNMVSYNNKKTINEIVCMYSEMNIKT